MSIPALTPVALLSIAHGTCNSTQAGVNQLWNLTAQAVGARHKLDGDLSSGHALPERWRLPSEPREACEGTLPSCLSAWERTIAGRRGRLAGKRRGTGERAVAVDRRLIIGRLWRERPLTSKTWATHVLRRHGIKRLILKLGIELLHGRLEGERTFALPSSLASWRRFISHNCGNVR